MKFITALFLAFAASTSFAADEQHLDNTSTKSLSVEGSEMTVFVSYPGHGISGICNVEIVADSSGRQIPIRNLVDSLEIKNAFVENQETPLKLISNMVARIPLRLGGYTDGVVIRTKDGRSLKENIERTLGKDRVVVLLPRSC